MKRLGLFLFLAACGGGSVDAASQMAVTTYAAQEQTCVTLASTEQAAKSCIAAVQAQWCGPSGWLHDAGACSVDAMTPDGGAK